MLVTEFPSTTVLGDINLYQVFMTQRDTLTCVHEPFGDAFYYGPERLSSRYEDDEPARVKSGFADTTYKTVMDRLLGNEANEVRASHLPTL